MLYRAVWSWKLRTWSDKMHLLDILSTSQHYFSRKWIGATKENLRFDLVKNIIERKDNSVKGSVSLELGSLVRDKETYSVGTDQGKFCLPFLWWPTTVTAKPKTSRQNQKPHGKTKDLTAKPNTSQQKPNTSRQKQIPTAKPKLFCFCCEVFGFAVRYYFIQDVLFKWGLLNKDFTLNRLHDDSIFETYFLTFKDQ